MSSASRSFTDNDCKNVQESYEGYRTELGLTKGEIPFTMLLIALQLFCAKKVKPQSLQESFPEEEELKLLHEIERCIKKQKTIMLRISSEQSKFMSISLRDYETTLSRNRGSNFYKFLAEAMYSSYKSLYEQNESKISNELQLSEYEKIKQRFNFDAIDDNKMKITDYLKMRRDSDSLERISSDIKLVLNEIKHLRDEEQRIVVQEILHLVGEYSKSSDDTPNLSKYVAQTLEEKGIPVKSLNKFRDILLHFQLFPLIDSNVNDLINNGLPAMKTVIDGEIVEIERNYLQTVIYQADSQFQPAGDNVVVKSANKKDVRQVLELVKRIKENIDSSKLEMIDKLIDELKGSGELMFSRNFDDEQLKVLTIDEEWEIRWKIRESLSEFIKQPKLKLYEKLNKEFLQSALTDSDKYILLIAHKDLILVEKLKYYYEGENPNFTNDDREFFKDKALEKLIVSLKGKKIILKDALSKYLDVKDLVDFDDNLLFRSFKENTEEKLIELLGTVKSDDAGAKKLTQFLTLHNSEKNIEMHPDEYAQLVNQLSISDDSKEILLSYSVEWRKERSKNIVKECFPSLRKIYELILGGNKQPTSNMYENLVNQYKDKVSDEASHMEALIEGKVNQIYENRLKTEYFLLKEVSSPYAVKSQILNVYDVLDKLHNFHGEKNEGESIARIKRLRNHLSHGDSLIRFEEEMNLINRITNLRSIVMDKLEGDITLKKIDEVIQKVQFESNDDDVQYIISKICTDIRFRRKRHSKNCITWEQIDEFNDEKFDRREIEKIKINSKKFIEVAERVRLENDQEFDNLISLADYGEVSGEYQNKVELLIDCQKSTSHAERLGKISGMLMTGMMAKDLLGDFLRHDYKGACINLGFIGGNLAFSKLANVASLKGATFISEGRYVLGKSLKLASPFLSKFGSAFIAYDLINQIKEYNEGNKDALVPIIGDNIILGVDVAEFGIEVAEGLGLIADVSAVTGPIGTTIGAVIFIGMNVYSTIKTVDAIDKQIHLTGSEKFEEGFLAFFGQSPPQYIQDLLEEKAENNNAANNGINYLKNNRHIQYYVFPSMNKLNEDFLEFLRRMGFKEKIEILYHNVDLTRKMFGSKWSRTAPDNPREGKIFCVPSGNFETGYQESYLCDNSAGVEYTENRIDNITLIDLGKGTDKVFGFNDRSNVFLIGEGEKHLVGGNKDDYFILRSDASHVSGFIDGKKGINTLDIGSLIDPSTVSVNLQTELISSNTRMKINSIQKFLGREGEAENVHCSCDTVYVNARGGKYAFDKNDKIFIPFNDSCVYDVNIVVGPNTILNNPSTNGNFTYVIAKGIKSRSTINLNPYIKSKNDEINHKFIFNYTIHDVIYINWASEETLRFNFVENMFQYRWDSNLFRNKATVSIRRGLNTEMSLSYRLIDGTAIYAGKNNIYAVHSTNKSVNAALIEEYSYIADKSQMHIVVQSTTSNTTTIGSGDHDVLYNDPNQETHLIGNEGENVFVITCGWEKLTLENTPIPKVELYDFVQSSYMDTLDLRDIKTKVKSDLEKECFTEIIADNSDLIISLLIWNGDKKHCVATVSLKNALTVNWIKRLNIIMENVALQVRKDEIHGSYKLVPAPLIVDIGNKNMFILSPPDIEVEMRIEVVKKKIGNYIYTRDGNNLLLTNTLLKNRSEKMFSVILTDFYDTLKGAKMKTITLKFDDREIILSTDSEKIENAQDFHTLKDTFKVESYNSILNNSLNLFSSIGNLANKITIINQLDLDTGLLKAVENGDFFKAFEFIGKGADVNVKNGDEWGKKIIHYAAEKNNKNIIEFLLKKGVNVNELDRIGNRPIYWAAINGHLNIVRFLLQKGSEITTDIINALQQKENFQFNDADNHGYTFLHFACKTGNIEVANFLLPWFLDNFSNNFADINARELRDGSTPFHLAAANNQIDILKKKFLLKVFYNGFYFLNNRTSLLGPPLIFTQSSIAQLVHKRKLLSQYDNNNEPDIDETDLDGKTALFYAATLGKPETVELLIKENANVKAADKDGTMVLQMASLVGNINTTRYLIQIVGADTLDNYGWSALHYAAYYGKLEIVKILVDKGANVSLSASADSRKPIHSAADGCHSHIIEFLLSKGANIEETDIERKTPLHLSVMSNCLETVKFLIFKGANVNAKDEHSNEPIFYAGRAGHKRIIEVLCKARSANQNKLPDGVFQDCRAGNSSIV